MILFMHTFGLGALAGLSGGIDLRILGFAPSIPLAPMKRLYPVMWAALAVTAASGTALLIADATTKLTSPVFYVKMVLVGLAVANLQLLKTRAFKDGEPETPAGVRLLAVTSLLLWVAATTAGRLMAYLGPVSGID